MQPGSLVSACTYERVSTIGERESERAWKIALDKFAPGMDGQPSLLFQRTRRMFFPGDGERERRWERPERVLAHLGEIRRYA